MRCTFTNVRIRQPLWTRSIRFPPPYRHLTANSKLYPISQLKPTGTYNGQLTLPPVYMTPIFLIFFHYGLSAVEGISVQLKLGKYKQCCNSSSFYFILFLKDKPWRHLVPHIWWQWSANHAWQTETKVLSHLVYPGVGFVWSVLKDRETGLSAQFSSDLTVVKALLKKLLFA